MDLLSSNKIRREQLKPGDHIYTWRRGYSYSHHGIYVGDENGQEVIHLTRAADSVVSCTMKDFLCGGDLNLYEYGVRPARFLVKRGGTCSLASSDPPAVVLHRASILLERRFGGYDLFHNNCEDFAIFCKTGFLKVDMSKPGRSQQIKFLTAALFAVISTPYQFLPATFACLALVVFGLYCGFRLTSDSGVEKVEVEEIVDLRYQRGRSRGTVPSGSRARWFLTAGEYKAYALMALRYWYWTPTSRILLWLRLLALYGYSYTFVTDHLRDHALKLKLREDVACIIWILGYWYWGSSDSAFFLWTKFGFLYGFLKLCISDPARHPKLDDYLAHTTLALVYWHWTPKCRILSWIKLWFGLSYIFTHFTNPRSKLLLCMLLLLYMFRNPIGSHFFGLGF